MGVQVESPSLEVCKERPDAALSAMVWLDLVSSGLFSSLNDSVGYSLEFTWGSEGVSRQLVLNTLARPYP